MGLFGDIFNEPWFDLNGDGKVDMFEEMIAFDTLFGGDEEADTDDLDDPFAPDDFGDYPFDF